MVNTHASGTHRPPGSRSLKVLGGVLVTLLVVVAAYGLLVRPWALRWGTTATEQQAALPGDELTGVAQRQVTRAITIHTTPERIWPWLVQMGAERGGWYSYAWLETTILRCPIRNAEHIVPQWQHPKLGDEVRLCPAGSGPPVTYTVGRLESNRVLVLGAREAQGWAHTWAFVLMPQPDGTTRLLVRSRTAHEQVWQTWVEFGEFVMERGMLYGIKVRAEREPVAQH